MVNRGVRQRNKSSVPGRNFGSVSSRILRILQDTVPDLKKVNRGFTVQDPPGSGSPALVPLLTVSRYRYSATVRVQQHRQEIIHEMSAMVKEHLVMFYKSTGGYKPHRIIIYRWGKMLGFYLALNHQQTKQKSL